MQRQRRELEALKTKATALRDEALVSQVCAPLDALGGWDLPSGRVYFLTLHLIDISGLPDILLPVVVCCCLQCDATLPASQRREVERMDNRFKAARIELSKAQGIENIDMEKALKGWVRG